MRTCTKPPYLDPLGLFGDGRPHWVVNKGKRWERPRQTIRQAVRQRNATTKKLRWHGNHVGNRSSCKIACNNDPLRGGFRVQ
jgi:SLT domain-containing protein